MNIYIIHIELNNVIYEVTKRCFPHQINEVVQDFCYDCCEKLSYGTEVEYKNVWYKKDAVNARKVIFL